MNLIPAHEDKIQKDVENIGTSTLEKFDISKLTVDPLKCDASLLPHLAVALDVSIAALDEDEARAYLQNSREIKKYIGSAYAVKKAASSIFGDDIEVQPWNKHGGIAGTYKFIIDANGKPVNDENINKTISLVDQAKRKSAHLSAITVNMKNSGMYNTRAVTQTSEVGSVFPKALENIETNINHKSAMSIYMIEKTVIKPQVGV